MFDLLSTDMIISEYPHYPVTRHSIPTSYYYYYYYIINIHEQYSVESEILLAQIVRCYNKKNSDIFVHLIFY